MLARRWTRRARSACSVSERRRSRLAMSSRSASKARVDLGPRQRAPGARALEQRHPRPAREIARERRARQRLGLGPQLGPVAQRQRLRAAAVAQRQPRAGQCGGRVVDRQPRSDLLGRQRVEAHELAARGDRRQHLAQPVGEQDQVHEVGRLLQRLEHAVGGGLDHRVGALDHEHAPGGLERRARGGGDHGLVDVGDQQLVRAGGSDPREIGMRSAAHSFVLAQQRGGHGPRDGALPGARRPVEQVGVAGRGAGGQRRLEHGARVGMVLEGGQGRHRCRS